MTMNTKDLPDVLASGKTSVMGSRDMKDRPISKVTWAKRLAIIVLSSGLVAGALGVGSHDLNGAVKSVIGNPAIQEVVAPTSEDVHWVKMPKSPLTEAGRTGANSDGNISMTLMLSRWIMAGIPLDELEIVLSKNRVMAPVVMGTSDPEMENHFWREAVLGEIELRRDYGDAIEKLTDAKWLAEHQNIYLSKYEKDKISHIEDKLFHEVGFQRLDSGFGLSDVVDDAHALEMVEDMMKQTGLRSFRVSAPAAADSFYLGNIALKIQETNRQIGEITGLEGKVLGLGGRVDMVLSYSDFNSSGSASLNGARGRPQVEIVSGLQSLPETWWGALDYVVASKSLKYGLGEPLSAQLKDVNSKSFPVLLIQENPEMVNAFKKFNNEVSSKAPIWTNDMNQRTAATGIPEWSSAQNIIQSAFASQISTLGGEKTGRPAVNEAIQISPLFEGIYKQVQLLDLTTRSTGPNLQNGIDRTPNLSVAPSKTRVNNWKP